MEYLYLCLSKSGIYIDLAPNFVVYWSLYIYISMIWFVIFEKPNLTAEHRTKTRRTIFYYMEFFLVILDIMTYQSKNVFCII